MSIVQVLSTGRTFNFDVGLACVPAPVRFLSLVVSRVRLTTIAYVGGFGVYTSSPLHLWAVPAFAVQYANFQYAELLCRPGSGAKD